MSCCRCKDSCVCFLKVKCDACICGDLKVNGDLKVKKDVEVCRDLRVKRNAQICGETEVKELCFKDQGVPPNNQRWCIEENAMNMLMFSYSGKIGPRLRITPTGTLLFVGTMAGGVENLTPNGGDANVDPDLNTLTTFVAIAGNGNVTGTLGNGSFDGQQKNVIVTASPQDNQYDLTVTNIVGAPNLFMLDAVVGTNDSSVSFIWSTNASAWALLTKQVPAN